MCIAFCCSTILQKNVSGATDSFNIPSDVKKVNVGWSSASVTTVQDGKISFPGAYQTITLSNLG